MRFEKDGSALVFSHQGERVRIEPWGKDSFRVRASMETDFSGNKWALTEPVESVQTEISIGETDHWVGDGTIDKRPCASITNGRIKAIVNHVGILSFYRDNALILREYFRAYDGTLSRESRCLKIFNREWKGIIGGSEYALNVKFEANRGEKLFGMGQYQQDCLDLKGCVLELAQRNSQISVPFAVSSLGYGFLWNNPAVGRVTFGRNYYEWIARATKEMDYWITAADAPKAILENYTTVTGRAEMFPEDLMGLWQCKLRYRTQEEVLEVARRYQAEGIKIDQIVIDFFHWTVQGDWKFDKTYWPDPKAMLKAVEDVKSAGCNALAVFLGNFGPETPETLIAKNFDGPCMYAAAAEGDGDLINGRGDAYCGMLNCSYNLGMRHLKAFIPEYPVGTAEDIAKMIAEFVPIARALIGLSKLKIITFGPRPQDFFACNAPIKGLYEIGVEVEENSELDLLVAYKAHAGDPRIPGVCEDMAKEMGQGCYYPEMSERMAQLEITLLDWAEAHKGAREYVAFADKCWPAFPEAFGFEPCYVNSRMVSRGIPVSCEVDIYGALSEYIGMCVSGDTVTLLDINNSVPASLYEEDIKGKFDYQLTDTFMGFHCGNTPSCKLCADRAVKYQLIQHRLLEPAGSDPDFTRGTLEGDIAASDITFYRLQCDSDGVLRAYIAQGEVLPVKTRSFGGIGVFAIPEMGRFYRHVLIQKRYPHHGAVAFGHYGKALFEVFKYLGIEDIAYNQPKSLPYSTENPWH